MSKCHIVGNYMSRLNTVSHFSYAPLIKCKITQKRNVIFLFWDYQRKAHLYLHKPLKFHCDRITNKWENGSFSALPSKHHFTLHYLEWNIDHIALLSGSNFCNARDKSRFILGNILNWNVFVITSSFFLCFTILVPSWPRFEKSWF